MLSVDSSRIQMDMDALGFVQCPACGGFYHPEHKLLGKNTVKRVSIHNERWPGLLRFILNGFMRKPCMGSDHEISRSTLS